MTGIPREVFGYSEPMTVCRSPRGVASMLAVVLTLIFFGLADEALERELFDIDHAVHDSVQGWRQPTLEAPMRALSDMGSGKVLIPLNLGLAALLWLRSYGQALVVPASSAASVGAAAFANLLSNTHP